MLDHRTSRSHAFLGDPHDLLAYNLSISDPNAMRSVIEQQPVGLGCEQKSELKQRWSDSDGHPVRVGLRLAGNHRRTGEGQWIF